MLLTIFIIFAVLSWIVSKTLQSRFKEYQGVPLGMTGAEVAAKMLNDNGIRDVTIRPIKGTLSDFYNPADHSINLSEDVYYGRNVSAAAVAAHETGHAVQHADGYAFLQLRTALVPLQNLSAKIINFVFIAMFAGAILLPNMISYDLALEIIIAAYTVFTLFAFVTLPVEINASTRAIGWLTDRGVIAGDTRDKAISALRWAAYTYVVAALSSLATLLYYIMIFTNRRD